MSKRPHHLRDMNAAPPPDESSDCANHHLRMGWYGLLLFLTLGVALEIMHGLKFDPYLNASNETRRLLWTLAHAHGTLLSLVNIGFAASLRQLGRLSPQLRSVASRCLGGATVLLPAGFFLGGIFIHAGDPGLPILLVPIGALLLFTAVLVIARSVPRSAWRNSRDGAKPGLSNPNEALDDSGSLRS